ncbi:hypothetical protein SCLCIDRAFT_244109 [Scleroderma citrinum Foug A]|uniref:Uncharacterized protein n=1 Tax=Scleroderma citrinum Foug A TaxID=1036808 RepID=A0A0C3D6F8_9AGAM|nr:hypothetical protein SCLCIDRAFT_244109 [Scleroderma citrinum Foug A]
MKLPAPAFYVTLFKPRYLPCFESAFSSSSRTSMSGYVFLDPSYFLRPSNTMSWMPLSTHTMNDTHLICPASDLTCRSFQSLSTTTHPGGPWSP